MRSMALSIASIGPSPVPVSAMGSFLSARMSRTEAGLKEALKRIPEIREEFWGNVNVAGSPGELNQNLERAGRVADFLEFAELLVFDALNRRESCGGHFREESQTEEGEASIEFVVDAEDVGHLNRMVLGLRRVGGVRTVQRAQKV